MDALRRNQYLQTIGVDVWVSRHPAAAYEESASEAAAPPVAQASASETAAVPLAQKSGRALHKAEPAVARPSTVSVDVVPAVVPTPVLDVPPTVTTWESLRTEVLACTKCPLHGSRTQGVFGVGSREAQWLVVGEAPGAEEDRRGEPFVGRAGHLLDAMLKAIGLSRGSNVYIANVLKSRPPGNRDPKPEEVAACLPYLMRQIELLKPRVMLAVGRIAAQNLLATDVPLGRLRGKVHRFGELNTPLIVTYHPAYLLRTPGDKRKAWEDLKFARSVFQGLTPT